MTVNLLSMISLPIELRANGITLGPPTGFFVESGARTFLVSNWHVLSGRNPETGQPLHKSGATPTHIKLKLHLLTVGESADMLEFPLVDKDGNPVWMQHALGQDLDIACLGVQLVPPVVRCYHLNEVPQHPLELSVYQDVVIIGFPRGFAAQGIFPIWKRGTIAAEPEIARVDGLPIYLIDTATREGMSGSPAYLISRGIAKETNGSVAAITGDAIRFLGVYSGRYGSESDMQLGRVWKQEVMYEMLGNLHPGSYRLRKDPGDQ